MSRRRFVRPHVRILEVARASSRPRSVMASVAILGAEIGLTTCGGSSSGELRVATFDIVGMTETGGPGSASTARPRGHPRLGGPLLLRGGGSGDGRPPPRRRGGRVGGEHAHRGGTAADRYRTHDLTRVLSRERYFLRPPPTCAWTGSRTDRRHVIFRGINFYPQQVESLISKQPGVGHEYQIVLDRVPAAATGWRSSSRPGEGSSRPRCAATQ